VRVLCGVEDLSSESFAFVSYRSTETMSRKTCKLKHTSRQLRDWIATAVWGDWGLMVSMR
jgi:hypothetical protein